MGKLSDISRLLEIAGRKKGMLIIASIFAIISSALQLAPFIAIYQIVRIFFLNASHPELIDSTMILQWGLVTIVALLASVITLFISSMCSHVAAFTILYDMRLALTAHIATLPMGYHSQIASGEVKKVIETNVEKLEEFIAHQLPDVISAIVFPVVLLGYLFTLNWQLSLLLLVITSFGMYLQGSAFMKPSGQDLYKEYMLATEDMNGTGVEYVRGMPAIKIFGIKADSFLTFKHAVMNYRKISLEITDMFRMPYSIFILLISSIATFLLPVIILFIKADPTNLATITMAVLFLIIAPSIAGPLMKLMFFGNKMSEISEGAKRIDLIFAEKALPEPEQPLTPTRFDIAFEGVSFAYEEPESDNYQLTLNNVSFVAQENQMTALVGPSGGGKSTIASLVLRFWETNQGQIKIGGVPITAIGTEQLMDLVSFVFQDVHLFYDTLEENIRMGNQGASQEEVIKAAKIACCHDFIEALPEGYQTKVGPGGTNLSGGEAQRIIIARAVLKDSPILVLDEATAYADAENEHHIQEGLVELVKHKTVLIIAHRLSTIRFSEQILVIKQGEIASRGTHDELLAQSPLYQKMWQAHRSASAWQLGEATEMEGN